MRPTPACGPATPFCCPQLPISRPSSQRPGRKRSRYRGRARLRRNERPPEAPRVALRAVAPAHSLERCGAGARGAPLLPRSDRDVGRTVCGTVAHAGARRNAPAGQLAASRGRQGSEGSWRRRAHGLTGRAALRSRPAPAALRASESPFQDCRRPSPTCWCASSSSTAAAGPSSSIPRSLISRSPRPRAISRSWRATSPTAFATFPSAPITFSFFSACCSSSATDGCSSKRSPLSPLRTALRSHSPR